MEMENNLPECWELINLVEDIDFRPTGVSPYSGLKKYFSTGSIQENNFTPEGEFTFENRPSRANREAKLNDVLQARMKNTDKGILVNENFDGHLFSTGFIQIKSFADTYNSKLLYYLIKSDFFLNQKNDYATGSTQEALTDDGAKKILIPLPPLAEQHRIVAKLDAVMQKIESNKQRLDKIPKLLKRFRQSVLAAAVNGKLTEDWREVNKNSVDDLIKKVNVIREEKYKVELETAKKLNLRKPKRPSNLVIETIDNDDFSIPDEWRLINLESSASIEHYAMSSGPFGSALGTKDYKENGVKVIRGQNIQNGTFIENNFVFISEEKANELKRSTVKEGDLIVVAVGSSGQVALVPKSMEGSIMSQNCNKMTFDELLIDNNYVLRYLQNSIAVSQLKDKTTDTARPFLSLTNLKSVIIPLPSNAEQKEIVRRVEQLFAFADKIEARYTKAKIMLDKLPQSILAKAFRGDLVAQDPSDEPASVLLERIKAVKEKLAVEKKGKKTKEYAIEETTVKTAAEKKVKYLKRK